MDGVFGSVGGVVYPTCGRNSLFLTGITPLAHESIITGAGSVVREGMSTLRDEMRSVP